MRNPRIIILLSILATLAQTATIQAFVLENDDYKEVDSSYRRGNLWGSSIADVVQGGFIDVVLLYDQATLNVLYGGSVGFNLLYGRAMAYDNSTVNISGGTVNCELWAVGNSTINISGGTVDWLDIFNTATVDISGGSTHWIYAGDSSKVDISGGSVEALLAYRSVTVSVSGGELDCLSARETSTVEISGGNIERLCAYGTSMVNIAGWDFNITGALNMLETGELTGTGTLTGKWVDGTSWSMEISHNDTTATIMLVPEPTTIALFALGSLALLKRRRQSRQL